MVYPNGLSPEAVTDLLLTLKQFLEAQPADDALWVRQITSDVDTLIDFVNEDL